MEIKNLFLGCVISLFATLIIDCQFFISTTKDKEKDLFRFFYRDPFDKCGSDLYVLFFVEFSKKYAPESI